MSVNSSLLSTTMVGDMLDRGRRFGATAFAGRSPDSGTALAKSVISLFNTKPLAHRWEPKAPSTVAVIDTALPAASMIERCVVPEASLVVSGPKVETSAGETAKGEGSPGVGIASGANRSFARSRR